MSSLHLDRTHDKPSSSLELLQALLQEKNQEIDHLNEQLLGLQEEVKDYLNNMFICGAGNAWFFLS